MNYQIKLEEMINNLPKEGPRKKLLLHACCAPCSSYCIEYLSNYFDITIYYYNPNIDTEEEFNKRVNELNKFVNSFNTINSVNIVVEKYDNNEFETVIKGRELDEEGSNRCFICYELRMDKAAKYAKDNNYDYFTTTLSISPYKNANKLNEIGEKLENKYSIKYLYADFKKKDGYRRSIELSKKFGLYRQDYCGCKYSKMSRDRRIEQKRIKELENQTLKEKTQTDKRKEIIVSKNIVLCILVFILAFIVSQEFPITSYNKNISNNSTGANKVKDTIVEEFSEKETMILEELNGTINEYYIYGKRLNIIGSLKNNYSNIKNVNLKFVGNKNENIINLKYKIEGENLKFYISDKLNTGFVLDSLLIDEYDVYLEVITEDKVYYHKIINDTTYDDTTYYSVVEKKERKKISLSYNETMVIDVSKTNDNNIYDIVIDPGHGGSDTGACNNEKCETDYTLMLSNILKEELENLGYKVALTRDSNIKLDNYGENGRVNKVHESNAKLCISIHLNDVVKGNKNGVEIYTPYNIDYSFARGAIDTIQNISTLDYSNNTFCKVEDGIYTRTFSETDINNVKKDAKKKNYTAFDVSLSTNYYFMIRETGGYITGAYADDRDGFGENYYVNSNKGIESYILELGYIKSDEDIKKVEKNKTIIMESFAKTIDEYIKN